VLRALGQYASLSHVSLTPLSRLSHASLIPFSRALLEQLRKQRVPRFFAVLRLARRTQQLTRSSELVTNEGQRPWHLQHTRAVYTEREPSVCTVHCALCTECSAGGRACV
jgi:hypothetical protein